MQPTPKIRSLLVIGGLLATAIGGTILVAPTAFHAANGIELAADANLLSEVRAPGGALFGFGVFMLAGAFVRSLTRPAVAVGALVYLAYGAARLLSIGLDGMPGGSLLLAAGIELVVGLTFAGTLRHAERPRSAVPVGPLLAGARQSDAHRVRGWAVPSK